MTDAVASPDRLATRLADGLAAFFARIGVRAERSTTAPVFVAAIEGHTVTFEATPGAIHVFCGLIDAGSADDQVEAVTLLDLGMPLPVEYTGIAEYRADETASVVGLHVEVPMPRTFNPSGMADALDLCEETVTGLKQTLGA